MRRQAKGIGGGRRGRAPKPNKARPEREPGVVGKPRLFLPVRAGLTLRHPETRLRSASVSHPRGALAAPARFSLPPRGSRPAGRPRRRAAGRERGLTPLAGVVPLLGQRRRRRWWRRRLLLLLLRRRRRLLLRLLLLLGRLRRRLLRGLLLLLLHRARPRNSPGSPVGGSDGVHLPG